MAQAGRARAIRDHREDAAARVGLNAGPLASFGQTLALVAILMTVQLVFTFIPARVLRNVGAERELPLSCSLG